MMQEAPSSVTERQLQATSGRHTYGPGQAVMGGAQQAVATAAADSQTPSTTEDVGGAGSQAGDQSSADQAAIVRVYQQLFGTNEVDQTGGLVNDGSRPPSPGLPEGFEPGDNTAIPSESNQEWHQTVTLDLRNHLIKNLIRAIVPTITFPFAVTSFLYSLMVYSRRVEVAIFDAANSRSEYYYKVAEKMYMIRTEIEEKRRKRREREQREEMQRQEAIQQAQPVLEEGRDPDQNARTASEVADDRRPQQHYYLCPEHAAARSLLQVDSMLGEGRQLQLQQWYMRQRLMLFQRHQPEQSECNDDVQIHAISTTGHQDADDVTSATTT